MIIHISCFFKTAYPFAIFSWLPKRLGKKLSVWRRAKKGRRRLGNERSPNRSFLVGPLFHHLWETVWNWGQTRWEGIQKKWQRQQSTTKGAFCKFPVDLHRDLQTIFGILPSDLSEKIWLGVVVEVVDELLHDRCSGVFLTFVHFKMIVDGGWWMGGLWWLSASVRSDYSLYIFVNFWCLSLQRFMLLFFFLIRTWKLSKQCFCRFTDSHTLQQLFRDQWRNIYAVPKRLKFF